MNREADSAHDASSTSGTQSHGQAGPHRQKAGFQTLTQVSPHDEYGQPEYDGVERAGNVPGVEHAQADGSQQQRVEGRPQHIRIPGEFVKARSGRQVPGDADVVYGIFMQPRPVSNLPRQRQGNAQRGDGGYQQGKAVGAAALYQRGGGSDYGRLHSGSPGDYTANRTRPRNPACAIMGGA